VVVDADTAMNTDTTGVYYYNFNEPATDLTYTAYIEVVLDGETYHVPRTLIGSPSSGFNLGLTVTDSRTMVGSSALRSLTAGQVDVAFRVAADELLRWQPQLSYMVNVAISTTADTDTVSLTNLAGWRGSSHIRHNQCFILDANSYEKPLNWRSESVMRHLAYGSTATDLPTGWTVLNGPTALFYPTPDAVYNLRITYDRTLWVCDSGGDEQTWVDGDSGDGAHYIQLPEAVIRRCAMGAVAWIQQNDATVRHGAWTWNDFVNWCQNFNDGDSEPTITRADSSYGVTGSPHRVPYWEGY